MLLISDREAVTAALNDQTLAPDLRALIGLRVWQADTDRQHPLGDTLQIVVVQPNDQPDAIHEAVGFPICWEQADQPAWSWMNDHGAYLELGYRLPDGVGLLVLVADHPDTSPTLLFNCLGAADRPHREKNKP